jgi:hypothetical protein
MGAAIAEITVPLLHKSGDVIACPTCGQDEGLTIIVDVADSSETPAFMRCDDAHQWAEPRVTRRFAAEVFAVIERNHPEVIDWSEVDGAG